MARTRRTPRNNPALRSNPIRDLVAGQQRAAEIARSRERAQQLNQEIPALIDNHVGEYIQKLETKLLKDFRELGERAVEESTAVLSEQLSDRIETLEQVSAIQSETLLHLRDSSRNAEQTVSKVVTSIESSLAGAIPGFKLAPPAHAPLPTEKRRIRKIQAPDIQDDNEPRRISSKPNRSVFCPVCTSVDVRRANRSGLFEQFLRIFLLAPFRCRACRHKFYRF